MNTSKKDRAIHLLKEALAGVNGEIEKCKKGLDALDVEERLVWMACELNKMVSTLGNDKCDSIIKETPGLWHIVIDTWPYDNPLGKKIVEAELAYEKCLNKK